MIANRAVMVGLLVCVAVLAVGCGKDGARTYKRKSRPWRKNRAGHKGPARMSAAMKRAGPKGRRGWGYSAAFPSASPSAPTGLGSSLPLSILKSP